MKVQYVADDGTIFDTEAECKTYEKHCEFGADARFLNVVDDILNPIVTTDERGNPVINFETEHEKIEVAVALARNLEKLQRALDSVRTSKSTPKKAR